MEAEREKEWLGSNGHGCPTSGKVWLKKEHSSITRFFFNKLWSVVLIRSINQQLL